MGPAFDSRLAHFFYFFFFFLSVFFPDGVLHLLLFFVGSPFLPAFFLSFDYVRICVCACVCAYVCACVYRHVWYVFEAFCSFCLSEAGYRT
ncbi:hypothetical protein B0H65DRAFT_449727 [Neurospora tetraspora]|uniref:Uncharacterized protein n=1 Tax=Neurospora tetraspora TaxID=94610 RepID=A0AAE0JNZ1_9PEZI|nr:hypothetical protein B0H65DRAFT_449727 [Neurospora tetraspora]